VAGGGTGLTTATAFAVLCGGTTATSKLQSTGPEHWLHLASNGTTSLPTFQAFSSKWVDYSSTLIAVFTSSGTYTPTSGMNIHG